MDKKSYEGLSIRIPLPIARELKKLKEETDLPSLGSALQIYIENIKVERLQSQFNELQTAIEESNQVAQVNQASTIMNTAMITVLMKAITPEKITNDPERQKVIKDAIKYLENNQAMIVNVGKAGFEQGKKWLKKHPQKKEKTEGNKINP